jgi:hypothetical protein
MNFPAALHEMFVLWPAWSSLVEYVSCQHPRDADPQSVYGAAMACDHDRLAALLYAHQIGDTLQEATDVLDDLLLMAQSGVRPRFGREMGLTRETFGSPDYFPGDAPGMG